jgi:hypothetical protein
MGDGRMLEFFEAILARGLFPAKKKLALLFSSASLCEV